MVLVDNRSGSDKLIEPLKRAGLSVTSTRLDYGDIAFVGRGIKGAPTNIGIEYKHVGELITSIRDGRFAGSQLLGMMSEYDHAWLLVEGLYRHDENGKLTTYKGRYRGWVPFPGKMSAVEFEKHVMTFEICGGIRVRFTNTQADSVRFILSLYRWWSDKDLDQHSSHVAVHTPHTIVPISDFRQSVYRFPGIGLKASQAVEQHFKGCLIDAVNANASEWASIEVIDRNGKGRKLGMKIAQDIRRFVTQRISTKKTG